MRVLEQDEDGARVSEGRSIRPAETQTKFNLVRAQSLVALGQIDEAIRMLTNIVLFEPVPQAYELLSHCYFQEREVEEAMVMQDLARVARDFKRQPYGETGA